MELYGGLIETMYKQYSEEEIPEKIKKYKERIDDLFLSETMEELSKKLENFSEKEVNYLSCVYLDQLSKIYKSMDPLKKAIKMNANEKIIELYLRFVENYDKYFRLAVCSGNLFIIRTLYKNIGQYMKNESLGIAANNGQLEVVKFLVENAKTPIDIYEHWPIRGAANNGHLEVVKYLHDKGGDIHASCNEALRFSASRGHLHIVEYLVENGANIDSTVVDYCFRYNQPHITHYLRQKFDFSNIE